MSNTYQILDNPLLTSGGEATESEIRSRAAPIYARLSAHEPFAPISATAVGDWSIQAGDTIRIDTPDGEKRLPVYTQKIAWNGGAKSTYQSTGSEKRPVQRVEIRKQSETERALYGMRGGMSSLSERVSNAEIIVDDLNANILLYAKKDELISYINISPEDIVIHANRINLEGYVTASKLNSELATLNNANAAQVNTAHLNTTNFTFKNLPISNASKKVVTSVKGEVTSQAYAKLSDGSSALVISGYHVSYSTSTIYYLDWE